MSTQHLNIFNAGKASVKYLKRYIILFLITHYLWLKWNLQFWTCFVYFWSPVQISPILPKDNPSCLVSLRSCTMLSIMTATLDSSEFWAFQLIKLCWITWRWSLWSSISQWVIKNWRALRITCTLSIRDFRSNHLRLISVPFILAIKTCISPNESGKFYSIME